MSLSSFVCTQLNGFKYCYVSLTIQLIISHLFAHSLLRAKVDMGAMAITGASTSDCLMLYPRHL